MIESMIFLYTGYSEAGSVLSLIGLIILCVLVIAASYYTTKFVGRRQKGVHGGGNFTVIDTFRLTQNKYLQLIKAGEKYIVIAVSKDGVTFITELSPDEVVQPQARGGGATFREILASAAKKRDREQTDKEDKEG